MLATTTNILMTFFMALTSLSHTSIQVYARYRWSVSIVHHSAHSVPYSNQPSTQNKYQFTSNRNTKKWSHWPAEVGFFFYYLPHFLLSASTMQQQQSANRVPWMVGGSTDQNSTNGEPKFTLGYDYYARLPVLSVSGYHSMPGGYIFLLASLAICLERILLLADIFHCHFPNQLLFCDESIVQFINMERTHTQQHQ